MIGKMLGVGMTTFMEVRGCFTGCPIGRVLACSRTTPPALPSPQLPSARLLSLAFTTFFAAYPNPSLVPRVGADGVVPDPEFPSPKGATMFQLKFHPRCVDLCCE